MSERAYCLAWSQVSGVGPVLLQRLYATFGSFEEAWRAEAAALVTISGIGPQLQQAIAHHRQTLQPLDWLEQHTQANPQFVTWADPDYPRLLREITDPPMVLYSRGTHLSEELQGITPAIGIVGTRDPSDYGKRWTHRITTALTKKGYLIISGMAEGVDTQAHRSCLEAGGRTFAVLGTGVDVPYPPRNQGLYQSIQNQGCVLSEYPSGTQPNRPHFPRRNRIIAGLSRVVLVTEAPTKSGALITAYLANDYGRDVYVVPGSLDNPRSLGCLGLLSRGAQVILGEGHLLEILSQIPGLDQPAPLPSMLPKPHLKPQGKNTPTTPPPPANTQLSLTPAVTTVGLNPLEESILQLLWQLSDRQGDTPIPFDLIAAQSDHPTGLLSSGLLQLELQGLVKQFPGMLYIPTSQPPNPA
jgi:DNA processing protein